MLLPESSLRSQQCLRLSYVPFPRMLVCPFPSVHASTCPKLVLHLNNQDRGSHHRPHGDHRANNPHPQALLSGSRRPRKRRVSWPCAGTRARGTIHRRRVRPRAQPALGDVHRRRSRSNGRVRGIHGGRGRRGAGAARDLELGAIVGGP